MPAFTGLTDGSSVVFLNKILKGLSRGPQSIDIKEKAIDGSMYRYITGSYFSASVPVDFVSSTDAYTILDWWRNKTPLSFDEFASSASVGGVSSLFISNRTAPIKRIHTGQPDYWRGTIELESF